MADIEKRISYFKPQFQARDDGGTKTIEGIFVPYGQETALWKYYFEEIAEGAFTQSIKENDIRVLYNHNSDVVLGRKSAKTVDIEERKEGVYARVTINPHDTEALNIYERVKRGDISGCSFGFYTSVEKYEDKPNGAFKSIIVQGELLELSVCPFPAYEQSTYIEARKQDYDKYRAKTINIQKTELKERLAKNGIKGITDKK